MASTRSKSRQHTEQDSRPDDSSDGYEERVPESNKTRGTKRVRTAKMTTKDKVTGKRQKKAKLWRLPEMPIDILYEVRKSSRFVDSLMLNIFQIFSLVHPRDLLHISWTAKILHRFLTTKSSRHVWQASFKGISEGERPPPCPSGITEMAYANLVYGRYCMVCVSFFFATIHPPH